MKRVWALLLSSSIAFAVFGCNSGTETPPSSGDAAKKPGAPGEEPPAVDSFAVNVKPLLDANCAQCHTGANAKKGVDMSILVTESDAKSNLEMIHKMVEELEEGHMPPSTAKQPSAEDKQKLIDGLKALG